MTVSNNRSSTQLQLSRAEQSGNCSHHWPVHAHDGGPFRSKLQLLFHKCRGHFFNSLFGLFFKYCNEYLTYLRGVMVRCWYGYIPAVLVCVRCEGVCPLRRPQTSLFSTDYLIGSIVWPVYRPVCLTVYDHVCAQTDGPARLCVWLWVCVRWGMGGGGSVGRRPAMLSGSVAELISQQALSR